MKLVMGLWRQILQPRGEGCKVQSTIPQCKGEGMQCQGKVLEEAAERI